MASDTCRVYVWWWKTLRYSKCPGGRKLSLAALNCQREPSLEVFITGRVYNQRWQNMFNRLNGGVGINSWGITIFQKENTKERNRNDSAVK